MNSLQSPSNSLKFVDRYIFLIKEYRVLKSDYHSDKKHPPLDPLPPQHAGSFWAEFQMPWWNIGG
jgi:hypothetical protein